MPYAVWQFYPSEWTVCTQSYTVQWIQPDLHLCVRYCNLKSRHCLTETHRLEMHNERSDWAAFRECAFLYGSTLGNFFVRLHFLLHTCYHRGEVKLICMEKLKHTFFTRSVSHIFLMKHLRGVHHGEMGKELVTHPITDWTTREQSNKRWLCYPLKYHIQTVCVCEREIEPCHFLTTWLRQPVALQHCEKVIVGATKHAL